MVKLSTILIVIAIVIVIFYFHFFILKENYTKEEGNEQGKEEGKGYPFFERSDKVPNPNSGLTKFPQYNGYCITYNSPGDCKFDNTNSKITHISNPVFDNFLTSFNGKIIGKLNIINNEDFSVKGKYGESNFNINKVISGQNNLPGTLTNIDTNVPINIETNKELIDNTNKNDLPGTGYSKYIKNSFISYINMNSKGNYNFIALSTGKVSIIESDKSKQFIIPFFIYEAKLNYTTGIVGFFTIKPNLDIEITNITQQDFIYDSLNLEPANINKTLFDIPILDTNGYFQIQNRLGLMYPFKTSTTGIIQPEDPNTFFKKTSEGEPILPEDLKAKIKEYETRSI